MQRPPQGVKLVIEAVCILKGIKPKKVAGEKPGSKVDDYWEPGKGLLQDPGKFLESLLKFDKVTQTFTQTLFSLAFATLCNLLYNSPYTLAVTSELACISTKRTGNGGENLVIIFIFCIFHRTISRIL